MLVSDFDFCSLVVGNWSPTVVVEKLTDGVEWPSLNVLLASTINLSTR